MLFIYKQYNQHLFFLFIIKCILIISVLQRSYAKYVEGHLKTLDDWVFLSRFCFISGKGRYEYYIEFERRYGEPNLLLYYDDESQWPAVYKTQSTCQDKLSVLSVENNQIIKLSARSPYSMMSGCTLKSKNPNPRPPFDIASTPSSNTADSTYYDQFLKSTPSVTDPSSSSSPSSFPDEFNATTTTNDEYISFTESSQENFFDNNVEIFNFTGFNDTYIFNSSSGGNIGYSNKIPISHDMVFENRLENGTDFIEDVEELFVVHDNSGNSENDGTGSSTIRIRRAVPVGLNFKREGRGTILVQCNNVGGFTSARERWWYIAISNCGSGKGLDITYKFRMTNGPAGDFWHEHFSADEMYIPPILLTESICYTILLIAVFFCAIELKSLRLFHCTYRLYASSVILQWFGVLIQGISWAKYGLTGLGPHTTIGGLFIGASEVSFLTLVLLLAKGYTVNRARLSSSSTIKLMIFVNIYIVVYIMLFIYQAVAFDPGEVLNLYESPAGFGLAGLRIGAWSAFVISIVTTLKKYPEKGTFYYPFGLFGSVWILAGPTATVLGIGILDPWVRESMICFVQATVSFGGHLSFLYLTWPSRANKSFPYHMKTNHVGIASNDDDGVDYPRHSYEPTLADQNTIIPLSRRTEELLNGVYGQYLIEHLGSTPNPHTHSPHLSTTRTTNAPSPLITAAEHFNNTQNSNLTLNQSQHQQLSPESLQSLQPSGRRINNNNNNNNNNTDEDNQDSGHPSLETSTTGSPNDTVPPSQSQTPKILKKFIDNDGLIIGEDENGNGNDTIQSPPSTATSKTVGTPQFIGSPLSTNPFLINRPPNKIILEPIELPIRELGSVPRHLFAAKNVK